jgi:hypothetical protein
MSKPQCKDSDRHDANTMAIRLVLRAVLEVKDSKWLLAVRFATASCSMHETMPTSLPSTADRTMSKRELEDLTVVAKLVNIAFHGRLGKTGGMSIILGVVTARISEVKQLASVNKV